MCGGHCKHDLAPHCSVQGGGERRVQPAVRGAVGSRAVVGRDRSLAMGRFAATTFLASRVSITCLQQGRGLEIETPPIK